MPGRMYLEILRKGWCLRGYVLLLDDDYSSPNTPQFLASIRKINKNITIIFFTDNDSKEFGRRILKIGVDVYLIKPVDENDIYETLKSVTNYINQNN